jgi:glycosyltransferase involved in cell wall biosynthesis
MRIAWLISLYPPYIVGGNEMLARDIVLALRERGHEVHVLTAHGSELDGLDNVHQVWNYDLADKDAIFLGGKAFTARDVLKHHVFDRTGYLAARQTLRELQPDLVVVDNQYMASAAGLVAAHTTGCPVVAQTADKWLRYLLWNLGLLIKPSQPWQRTVVSAYTHFAQPLLRRPGCPDYILAISEFIKDQYVEAGFPASRIDVGYLGIDTALYHPRTRPHSGDNNLQVVFAGQLWEGKGPQVLVEALGMLRRQVPGLDLSLRIIGEGSEPFKAFLKAKIREQGLEDRTHLDGFVPLSGLAERLRNADLFVFPSTWDEPFSITLVAAMASGAAVIATRTGGTPEALVEGVEGVLIPPGDATTLAEVIQLLASDPDRRNELGQAASARAHRQWSFDAYVGRLEQYYARVLAEAGSKGQL